MISTDNTMYNIYKYIGTFKHIFNIFNLFNLFNLFYLLYLTYMFIYHFVKLTIRYYVRTWKLRRSLTTDVYI